MTSAPAAASIRDSASGFPCSLVMARATLSLRSRKSSAARPMTFDRSKAEVWRHFANPRKAAAKASSRSALSATACAPICSSFAGLSTGACPPWPGRQCPSMKSCVSKSIASPFTKNARCLGVRSSGPPCSLQPSSILILSRGAGQGFLPRRGGQQAGRTRMKTHRVQMRSSFAGICFAILASCIASVGSDPAIAQDVEIAKTDSLIHAVDQRINLFLREKMAAGNSKFTDDNIVLFLHGATSPSSYDFDLPYKDYSWADWLAKRGYVVYMGDYRNYGGLTPGGAVEEPARKNQPLTRSYLALRDVAAMVDWIKAKRGVKQVTVIGWSWGAMMMAGYYASLDSENVPKLVLYAPLYNFNDHTNLGPGSGLQNKRKPLEFNFALGAYRLVPETANMARWNGEIPLDNKDEYRDPALPAEFWKACLATDPTSGARNPVSLRAPNGVLEDSFYQATGRPLWNAASIYAPTLVIAGQYDTWSYPEDREGLMRDLVHAAVKQSVLIPYATHFVLFEKNRLPFFDAILKFLKE